MPSPDGTYAVLTFRTNTGGMTLTQGDPGKDHHGLPAASGTALSVSDPAVLPLYSHPALCRYHSRPGSPDMWYNV